MSASARTLRIVEKALVQLMRAAYLDQVQLHLQRLGRALGLAQLRGGAGIVRVRQDRDVGDRWHRFFEQLQPFPA